MKRFSLLILFGALCGALSAQNTAVVKGIVIDGAANTPLIGATVILDSTRSMATGADGSFSFQNMEMKKGVKLEISFLGYQTDVRVFDVDKREIDLGRILLKEQQNQIEKITVEAEVQMSMVMGDTVQFNAAAFKTNPDADAGDLMNKMPGITVENGTVEAQGETVRRIYVDGKLLFGNDTKSPLTDIPADAIEGIQVFDELSDEAKFIGYDDGERTKAINIVTKHKVNRSTTARLEAGYGFDLEKDIDDHRQGRYFTSATFNTFTEKNSWTLNTTFNNVNRRSAANDDDAGSGGGGNGLRKISNLSVGYAGSRGEDNNLKFNVNYNYNHTNATTESQNIQDYFPTDDFDSRLYISNSNNKRKFANHNVFSRVEYQGKKNRIYFQPNLSYNTNNGWGDSERTSIVDEQTQSRQHVLSNSESHNLNFSGDFGYTQYIVPGKTFLSLSLNSGIGDSDSDSVSDTQDEVSGERTYNDRNNSQNDNSYSGGLNLRQVFSSEHNLSANYNMSYQKSDVDVYVYDEFGELDSALTNVYSRNNLVKRGGIRYNFNKERRIRVNAGLQYQATDVKRNEDFPDADYDRKWTFYAWTPNLRFTYNEREKGIFASFNYTGRSSLPSVNRLQNVINNSNTLQLSSGNPNLKQSYTHQLEAVYRRTNMDKNTFFNARITANFTNNYVANRTEYFTADTVLVDYNNYVAERGSQLTTPVNLDGYREVRGQVGYSFPLALISSKIDVNAGYSYRRTPGYSGDQLNQANGNSFDFSFKVASNISENVDFDIQSRTNYQLVSNTAKDNTRYIREVVTMRLNVIFLGGFVFNSNYTLNFTKNMSSYTTVRNPNVWNAGVGRKFFRKRQGEVRVTVYDILNQNTTNYFSIQDNYTSEYWSNTLGRYVMASFTYRFNSMNRLSRGGERREGGERGGDFGPGGGRGPGAGGPGGRMGGGMF